MVTRGLWIRRKGGLLYNSFLQDEKALEICFTTNVKILNITICSKMGKMVKFYVKYFFYNENHEKAKSSTNYNRRHPQTRPATLV